MPIGEVEHHPFLEIGEGFQATRLIVGTFPIYSLTSPTTDYKKQLQQRGDIEFFYGSLANYFWEWYQKHVDSNVKTDKKATIISSLETKAIAISDVVKQCTRLNESFNDNHLRQKVWNSHLASVIDNGIARIICTSKAESGAMGLLIKKILIPAGYVVETRKSIALHRDILQANSRANDNVKPIAAVLTQGQHIVSIVTLPSPGSPYRQLGAFGLVKGVHRSQEYLQRYLEGAFAWFS